MLHGISYDKIQNGLLATRIQTSTQLIRLMNVSEYCGSSTGVQASRILLHKSLKFSYLCNVLLHVQQFINHHNGRSCLSTPCISILLKYSPILYCESKDNSSPTEDNNNNYNNDDGNDHITTTTTMKYKILLISTEKTAQTLVESQWNMRKLNHFRYHKVFFGLSVDRTPVT